MPPHMPPQSLLNLSLLWLVPASLALSYDCSLLAARLGTARDFYSEALVCRAVATEIARCQQLLCFLCRNRISSRAVPFDQQRTTYPRP